MIRRPPRSTLSSSSAASDVYKRQERMKSDPKIRIQYAGKYVSASNSWKKWQGEVKGLQRLDAVNVKKAGEAEFTKWVTADPERIKNCLLYTSPSPRD